MRQYFKLKTVLVAGLLVSAVVLSACTGLASPVSSLPVVVESEVVKAESLIPSQPFSELPETVVPLEPVPDPVALLMKALTLPDKIAQLFIVALPRGADLATLARLRFLNPGGYILYSYSFNSIRDVQSLTTMLLDADAPEPVDSNQQLPIIQPFICVDQEGGRVAAFRFKELPSLPAAFYLGETADLKLIEAAARLTGAQLRYLGVNLNFAPVADLYSKADSSVIGDRSFGPEPEAVAAAVTATVRGLHEAGVMATVKHFPGHGVTTVDSHGRLPVADISLEALRDRELVPFVAGIEAGVNFVMTAHILFPAVDTEHPVTLSPIWLKEILRDQLGFEGLILTDGFEMGALTQNYGRQEALARAFEAGIDLIVLLGDYKPEEMIDLVETMIAEGRISETLIDEHLRRVLELKYSHGLIKAAD